MRTTSNCCPLPCRKTNARPSAMILPRLTGGNIGLTSIFRHCGGGFIRSSNGVGRNRVPGGSFFPSLAGMGQGAGKLRAQRGQGPDGRRRCSQVSTVAVAGTRSHEVVTEDSSIDWNRSDYDPYARTKKFCEHMVRELLPEVPRTVFRPSIVLGDSRRAETTQFDMVRAFVFLAG